VVQGKWNMELPYCQDLWVGLGLRKLEINLPKLYHEIDLLRFFEIPSPSLATV
jgi:hypothetical protein